MELGLVVRDDIVDKAEHVHQSASATEFKGGTKAKHGPKLECSAKCWALSFGTDSDEHTSEPHVRQAADGAVRTDGPEGFVVAAFLLDFEILFDGQESTAGALLA